MVMTPRTVKRERCPVCVSTHTRFFFQSTDRLHGVPGVYTYHRCQECRTVFQNPVVVDEDLELCYPSEYSPYRVVHPLPDVDFSNLPLENIRDRFRKGIVDAVRGTLGTGVFGGTLFRILASSPFLRERAFYGLVTDECLPQGREIRALDVGCGSGWYTCRLAKVGWEIDALEWDSGAAAFAQQQLGRPVAVGDFRQIELSQNTYHLILLHHVFEHLKEPREVLTRLRSLLADGGRVVLYYPNPDSISAKWFGTDWFPWEVPRHLVLPSPRALQVLAGSVGFRKSRVFTRPQYNGAQWVRSKAYRIGLNPERDTPPLDALARCGVVAESLLAQSGLDVAWETAAVLWK